MNHNLTDLKKETMQYFSCQKCGNCCKREGGYVYVTDREIANIVTLFNLSVTDFKQKYTKQEKGWYILSSPTFNTKCFLQENNTCKIYPVRPKYCQEYPGCEDVWESETSLKEESQLCPGLNQSIKIIDKKIRT